MLESIKELDQEIFLKLNNLHSPFFDDVMWFISGNITWIPLYLFLITLIIISYGKKSFYWLIAVAILILIVDQLTSGFMKPFFGRLRPCHDPEIGYLVHNVKKCGGKFSFVSGHAANSFAVATFMFLLLKKHFRYLWLLFIWSSVVAYSRIYLGVHYPLDIICGGFIGALFAMGIYYLFQHYLLNRSNKLKQI